MSKLLLRITFTARYPYSDSYSSRVVEIKIIEVLFYKSLNSSNISYQKEKVYIEIQSDLFTAVRRS